MYKSMSTTLSTTATSDNSNWGLVKSNPQVLPLDGHNKKINVPHRMLQNYMWRMSLTWIFTSHVKIIVAALPREIVVSLLA